MRPILMAVLAIATTGCAGALAGGTIVSSTDGVRPPAVYDTQCATCHGATKPGTGDLLAPSIFSAGWRVRIGDAETMDVVIVNALRGGELVPVDHVFPALSSADRAQLRTALLCHHYPRSASCRKETS